MIVVETPSPGWLQHRFRCGHCAALIQFEVKDLRDKAFRPRQTMSGVWAVRARCAVCANPLAKFTQEVSDGDGH